MRLPLLHRSPALKPTELSEMTARAVDELLREGESRNTQASYRSALRYWAAWFGLRYGVQISLPLPVPAVLQFIVDHAQRGTQAGLRHELPAAIDRVLVARGFKGKPGPLALATVTHRIYVLSKAHQMKGLKSPCSDSKVQELLAMTRRAYAKRGVRPQQKDALTRDPLQSMLATCDDSPLGVRDRALLLFAWASGGRRRSEVAAADMRFLKRVGPDFIYQLVHSKTNQAGADHADNFKPVTGSAAHALQTWLQTSGITEGAVFRRVLRGGHIGPALSPAAVRDIVRKRASLAGLEGDFSAHSLRSGFVTEAVRRAVPLADTMAMTGHTSVQSVIVYTRTSPTSSAAAHLLDRTPAMDASR